MSYANVCRVYWRVRRGERGERGEGRGGERRGEERRGEEEKANLLLSTVDTSTFKMSYTNLCRVYWRVRERRERSAKGAAKNKGVKREAEGG
jgi:hypothetical protein